jgi:hypothetical protein
MGSNGRNRFKFVILKQSRILGGFFGFFVSTQALMLAKQELYHLSYSASPKSMIL